MSDSNSSVARVLDKDGVVKYYFLDDQTWDGFDTIIKYMQKYWPVIALNCYDEVYTRHCELILDGAVIRVTHDSQGGNCFFADDSNEEVLDQVYHDLLRRLR